MVRKYVFCVSDVAGGAEGGGGGGGGGGCEEAGEVPQQREEADALHRKNDELHRALNACKNQISRYYHNRKWDMCKKFTNEYELVFTSSFEHPGIAAHVPISRSFFKLWEMLHDFGDELVSGTAPALRAVFLAEGPGGFMESFAKYRAGPDGTRDVQDVMHGMTLMSKHKNIPNWKVLSMFRAPSAQLHIHRGADGTGDLYNVANIDALVADAGEAACDFVTADGGFDFSNDFNNQEGTSLRLVLSEVYAALRLQAKGGSFVLKVYDMHAPATLQLLCVLRKSYGAMRFVKPLTSRPANSEKYVMCTAFRGAPAAVMRALRAACMAGGTPAIIDRHLQDVAAVPVPMLQNIIDYNTHYIARQVCYISRTILLIQEGDSAKHDAADRLRMQLRKSLRWCHKYHIPSSLPSLNKYRDAVTAT